MERNVMKSGTRLVYLPISEIINRMNRIFGPTGWSHEVISCHRDAIDPDWVVAHVRVHTSNGGSHDGFGGSQVKRRKTGEIVDLGDEFKGAVSDALKKACQHFGVGLYLARDIEAIEIDDAMHAPQPEPTPLDEKYDRFMEVRALLDDDQVKTLKEYWNTYSDGRPVPKRSEFTEKELEILTVEALRLHLGASTIANVFDDVQESDVEE
jgi:recombination DNA repair RAD52 pathway protein